MRRFKSMFILLLVSTGCLAQNNTSTNQSPIAIAIHGGAGTILKSQMTPEREKAYIDTLTIALKAGYSILQKGGSSLDAVEAAIHVLEDCPLFNAGRGSVFTNEGKNEMDAAIMNGKTLAAGSVAGVTTIKNPISAARAVMEKSPHVMMAGRGAEAFAQSQGLTIVDPSYFFTEDRWKGLQQVKKEDSIHAAEGSGKKGTALAPHLLKQPENRDYKYGTVGAVALDRYGNLAAGTSTGGMTNKKFGRIGDAPIIGAGTYANNATCAVSCTGWGEYFIRLVVGKTVSDLIEYKKLSVKDATNELVMKQVPALGGDGGLIALDKNGNIAMPFNTEGMYRAFIDKAGNVVVKIYKE